MREDDVLLDVKTRDQDGWVVVVPTGEIDISSASVLDDALEEALDGGADRVAVDLTAVDFMDSTGLRSLIVAQRRLDADGGRLVVVAPPGPVRRVLEVAGVVEALAVVESATELPPT